MARQQAPGLDEAAEAELESSAARIAQIIAAAAYEVSIEVARWPEELREQAAAGFKMRPRTQ
ncbi:hypothetical protein C3942_20715 [Solimonas fluminis]|uniref:Uncharacterized protein n=1 Tax=Solimonas fluminis TaxID=2086571 RepID=A0A2S5TAI6_9GAMM|nr:hypothetical protein [Solimonas fluminis]PPE71966.1 hypothetical protein C3942_20715 [Solimonas fluminis]